jgi:hypothetical protein
MKNYATKPQTIIQLIPGITFLLEGVQKFVYTDTVVTGRFQAIGIANAGFGRLS